MAEHVTIAALMQRGILTMGDGYRTKRSEHGQPGHRIIRVADVRDGNVFLDGDDFVSDEYTPQMGAKVAIPGDVLLTTKGTVGRVAVMPATDEPAVYSPQLCYFRIIDRNVLDPGYLRYWFGSKEFLAQASFLQGNTDMAPYISLSDLRAATITLPSLPEQTSIAAVLGVLDDKIAANTRLAATADDLARALLALAEPNVPVSEIAVHSRLTVSPEGMAALRVAHFSLPAFDVGTGPEVVAPESIKSNKFLVSEPAVLVSKLNPRFPRVWNIPHLPVEPALASTEFVVLVPTACSTTVLWALTSQPRFGAALEGMVAGTSGSHQRVKPAEMLATLVPDPRRFEPSLLAQVDALGARSLAARTENVTLVATRDTLLPQLMSGKLMVREAAEMAGL